jgi:hypothetical protein
VAFGENNTWPLMTTKYNTIIRHMLRICFAFLHLVQGKHQANRAVANLGISPVPEPSNPDKEKLQIKEACVE